MKGWMIGGMIGLGVIVWAGWAASSAIGQKVPAAQFGWLADFQAARNLAKKTGKPLMVVFRCEP